MGTKKLEKIGGEERTGAEVLRCAVSLCNASRESTFDDLTAEEVINLCRACWASDWDVYPDNLRASERKYAARHAKLPAAAEARFERDGGPS
jgi:hypothetical protein